MKTYEKTKGITLSKNPVEILIEGKKCKAYNLYKSDAMNSRLIVLQVDSIKYELDCVILGGDNSDLRNFKNFVESLNLKFSDLGLKSSESKIIDYEKMTHENYLELEKEFGFDYYKIGALHKHLQKYGRKSPPEDLKGFLVQIKKSGEDILEYIKRKNNEDSLTIKNLKPMEGNIQETRELQLIELGMDCLNAEGQPVENSVFSGYGVSIARKELSDYDSETWASIISQITDAAFDAPSEKTGEYTDFQEVPKTEQEILTPEQTAALLAAPIMIDSGDKSVSLEAFSSLKESQIIELIGLKEKQEQIVAANPFIEVKDAATLKKAKAHKAALLKASTSTESIETNATKYLNNFKNMLKTAIGKLSKITRDAHEKQAKSITDYENAEKLRQEKEQREKLEKIKKRTDALFAVPFVFNGAIYSIGTLYVTPSQIEDVSDEEFEKFIVQGKSIKQVMDAEAEKNATLEKQIEALKNQIAILQGTAKQEINTIVDKVQSYAGNQAGQIVSQIANIAGANIPVPTPTIQQAAQMIDNVMPAETAAQTAPVLNGWDPGTNYTEPIDGNKLLSAFDLNHLHVIQQNPIPVGFIKCREYYKFGLRDLATEIQNIMQNPAPEGVKKPDMINELVSIILTQQ